MNTDELVRGAGIAFRLQALSSCPAFDTNDTGSVDIDEIIAAVNAAQQGCSAS